MKQNNKDYYFSVIILLLIAAVGVWFSYHSTSYTCSKYPDKCVCENWCQNHVGMVGGNLSCDKTWEECRRKSQSELDIDDCNSNPREDKDCKCEKSEISYCQYNPNNNGHRCIEENISFKDCCINILKGVLSNKCIKSHPKTDVEKLMDKDCDLLFKDIIDTCHVNHWLYGNECNKIRQEWRQKGCQI